MGNEHSKIHHHGHHNYGHMQNLNTQVHHQGSSTMPGAAQRHHEPLDFTKNIPSETDIPYPPFINVEGVPNFRDIGGYRCPAPQDSSLSYSIRRQYAFRCSELSQLTPRGNTTMAATLQIQILFDLRSEAEAANPRGQPKHIECVSTPVFPIADVRADPHLAASQLRWYTAPDRPGTNYSEGYVDAYRDITVHGTKAFRRIFEHIRDHPEKNFVYHCTAGKDRTGVLTALIQKLCGVDDDVVSWDYSLTVPGMGRWEEIVEEEMVGDSMMPVRRHGGMTREEAQRVCGSRKENMRVWLDQVLKKEYGGAERYLTEKLHFTADEVRTIRQNLVVQAEPSVQVREVKAWSDHPQT